MLMAAVMTMIMTPKDVDGGNDDDGGQEGRSHLLDDKCGSNRSVRSSS